MITLFHSPGARSMRCVWLLEELGVDYQLESMAFPPRVNAPEFLKINPLGSVPYLTDGEIAMNESCAILQYLSGRYGKGEFEMSATDSQYADYLNWLYFGECSLTALQAVVLRYAYFMPKDKRRPDVAEDFQAMVNERIGVLSAALEKNAGEYLCGEKFTLADISVVYALVLMSHFKLDTAFTEAVRAYFARVTSRPAFRQAAVK